MIVLFTLPSCDKFVIASGATQSLRESGLLRRANALLATLAPAHTLAPDASAEECRCDIRLKGKE